MKLGFKYKLAVNLLNILSGTWRITIRGEFPQKPAIIAFWHGQMLPVWKAFQGKSPVAVVSRSRDGEVLSALLKKWGFRLVRGSSSKGGEEVLEEATALAGENYVLMTPDGPRGPVREMKAGAAVAAFRSGSGVVLCGAEIYRKRVFSKSWDNFELPLPFSKIELTFSEPIKIPGNSSRNEINSYIRELEYRLNKMNRQ